MFTSARLSALRSWRLVTRTLRALPPRRSCPDPKRARARVCARQSQDSRVWGLYSSTQNLYFSTSTSSRSVLASWTRCGMNCHFGAGPVPPSPICTDTAAAAACVIGQAPWGGRARCWRCARRWAGPATAAWPRERAVRTKAAGVSALPRAHAMPCHACRGRRRAHPVRENAAAAAQRDAHASVTAPRAREPLRLSRTCAAASSRGGGTRPVCKCARSGLLLLLLT